MQKQGIEVIKKALSVGLNVAQGVHNALADDNKISFWEGLGLTGKVFPIAEVINRRKELLEEIKDLDETEKGELAQWLKTQYQVPSEKVENTVHKALALFINLLDFSMEMVEVWGQKNGKK